MAGKISLAWLLAAATCLSSCGGVGSGTSTYQDPPADAPAGLDYPDPNLFTEGEPIRPLVPRLSSGTSSNYWVEPELPPGLVLEGTTGIISGTPTEARAEGTYTVFAANLSGRSQFGVRITVHGSFTVGGVVLGLTGTGLVLTSYGENVAISSNGTFAFGRTYAAGSVFDIYVSTQPGGQTCTVSQGSGQVSNVDYGSAIVTCTSVSSIAERHRTELPYLACYAPPGTTPRGLVVNPATGISVPLGELVHDPDPRDPQPAGCEFQAVKVDDAGSLVYVLDAEARAARVYRRSRITVPLPGSLSTSSRAP
jgi:hypothetical protein